MKPLIHLSSTIVRIYFREPLTVFLSIGLLVLMMVLFGVMSSGDITNLHLPIGVLDETGKSSVVQTIQNDEVLSLRRATNQADLSELIRTAQVIAGVVVSAHVDPAKSSTTDNIEVIVSDSPQNHWVKVGIEHLRVLLNGRADDYGKLQVRSVHVAVINNRFIDFIFPGVLALSILQASLGSAVVVLDAKRIGVLRRLQLAPIGPLQLFGGFFVGRCVIVLIHLAIITLVAMLFFGAQILSPVSQLLFAVLLGIVCFMSMAGVVALLAPSFEAGSIIIQLLNFPMAFLCGVFFRNENMPLPLQWFSKLMPLTYFVDLMRGLIQEGLPLSSFPLDIGVLTAWSVGVIGIFLLAARWRGTQVDKV